MNWKKWFAIILTPVMLGCLTEGSGYGQVQAAVHKTEEEMLQVALEKLENAESMHSDLTMDMEVKVFGFKTGMEASMNMISFQSPAKVKADINLDLGILGSAQLEAYAREQETGYQLFLKDSDGWRAGRVAASQLCRFDGRQLMKVYLEQIVDLKASGTGKLDGRKVYQYTGTVQSDGLKAILVDTGSLKLLSALFQDTMLKSLGGFLQQEEEVSKLLAKAEDIEVHLWIDAQTGYAVKCTMDITEMMSEAYRLLFGIVDDSNTKAENYLWSKIEVTKTELMINCSDMNNAEDFAIPKDALKAY